MGLRSWLARLVQGALKSSAGRDVGRTVRHRCSVEFELACSYWTLTMHMHAMKTTKTIEPISMRQRLWLLAAPLATISIGPSAALAADMISLSSRLQGDMATGGGGGNLAATPDMYPILAAQRDVKKLLEDEETFRTMVKIGLPTGNLQMPPIILFNLFKRLEDRTRDPGAFMESAIEYVEYTRDANDLVELARLSRTNGGGPPAVQDYLDRSIDAAKGAAKALDRMVPLLPQQ